MKNKRSSGILLHPTSLPGPDGIGDLGRAAYRFIDLLEYAGQRYWQVLPLGPTGYGDSPYQCFSLFAANPLLIDLDDLRERGLLEKADLASRPPFPGDTVDYGWVIYHKLPLLKKAFAQFKNASHSPWQKSFAAFCEEHWYWLDDYALFMALRDVNDGQVWNRWEPEVAGRSVDAIAYFTEKLAYEVEEKKFQQFLFFEQWQRLRKTCREKGIGLIGTAPMHAAHDSSDVWAHPDLFQLDDRNEPACIGGLPPDAIHPSGQVWGLPTYRWDRLAETGYHWWIDRIRTLAKLVDVIRLEYFPGYVAYWEIPTRQDAGFSPEWKPGPGAELFYTLQGELGDLPFIAEDLGPSREEVDNIKSIFDIPGMAVLQHAFSHDMKSNPHSPDHYHEKLVAYTGTHDNRPVLGWFDQQPPNKQKNILSYLQSTGEELEWEAIRTLLESNAGLTLFPMQDILGLGDEARMSKWGRKQGNWQWRFRQEQITEKPITRLRHLTKKNER